MEDKITRKIPTPIKIIAKIPKIAKIAMSRIYSIKCGRINVRLSLNR